MFSQFLETAGFQLFLSLIESNHILLLHSFSYVIAVKLAALSSLLVKLCVCKAKEVFTYFQPEWEALLQGRTCFYFGAYRAFDIIHFDQATFYLISDATCFVVQVNFLLQICINCQHYPISQLHIPSGN